MTTSPHIQKLCRDVALTFHANPYAERAARLLFMTAAHESGGWRYRRQMNVPAGVGAYGLWQIEAATLTDTLKYIAARPDVLGKAREFADRHGYHTPLAPGAEKEILKAVQQEQGDALCCLLARVNYLRKPTAIPKDLIMQAEYAKIHWNTSAGKATWVDYLGAFLDHWPELSYGEIPQ